MARIRSIKPELASSKKLTGIPIDARYTLVLLITQADDDGFLLAEPRQLLGALYPHDETVTPDALEGWLLDLAKVNSIAFRWTTDGARVLQILGWHEHQRVKNPSKSKILPTLTPVAADSTETLRRTAPESGGAEVGSRKGEEGKGKKEGGVAGAASAAPAAPADGGLVHCFDDPAHIAAYLAYRRSHRMPDGLDAALKRLNAPLVGGAPLPWPVIGAALVEMRGASADFTPAAVGGFARRLQREALAPAAHVAGTSRAVAMILEREAVREGAADA